MANICSAANFKALEHLPEKRNKPQAQKRAEPQPDRSDEPEVDEEDSLDVVVTREGSESASDEGRKSSAELEERFRSERFRPHLVAEAVSLRKAMAKKGKAPPVVRGTQHKKKGKNQASDSSSESDGAESSESDGSTEGPSSETSEEEATAKRAGSHGNSSDSEQGREKYKTRANVGRPPKRANTKQGQHESAFGAAVQKGRKREASLVEQVQSAETNVRLRKQAEFAQKQSVPRTDGQVVKKSRTRLKENEKTGSTAKAGGLRESIYK